MATTPDSASSFGLTTIGHSADVLDMPVDPNEPTYCLCHQVSYGEMIGCDNPDVNFHSFSIERMADNYMSFDLSNSARLNGFISRALD